VLFQQRDGVSAPLRNKFAEHPMRSPR
jgi:hypothetical protein